MKSETELYLLYGCQWNCYSIQTVKMLHFWHHFSNVPLGSSQSTNCLLVLSPLSTLGSVVGIVTGYGLDGPGIESRWGRIFRTCPDRPWGPPSLLYNGYWVFPGGKERPGRDVDPSPPYSAVDHERLELYLYFPYGPYGLYRASVPVQGCTLPYLLPSQ